MIDKKTYEELMSYLVKVECDRLKEEQQAQSASKAGIEHRSNEMHGSASSKHTASGAKTKKLVVSSFVSGSKDGGDKAVGKIIKTSAIGASSPGPLHTQGSGGGGF